MRRLAETGQPLDQELLDTLLGRNKDLAGDLNIAAYILFGISPGMVLLGSILGLAFAEGIFWPLVGVGGLTLCIGIGMKYAANSIAD